MARFLPAVLSALFAIATPILHADVTFASADSYSGATYFYSSSSIYSGGSSITIVNIPTNTTVVSDEAGALSFSPLPVAPFTPAILTDPVVTSTAGTVVYPTGTYFGLLTLPNGTGSAIGSVRITFGKNGRGTGIVRIGNNAPCALQVGPGPGGGTFNGGGPISVPILIFKPGDPDMLVNLTLNPPANAGDPPTITGTVSDDGTTFPVTAISTKPANAGALAGQYTFELTDPTSTDLTDLSLGGFGGATVSATGAVHAYITLADGSILTPTGTINSAGTFDFITHSRKGALFSASLVFGPSTTGTAHWELPEVERHDRVVRAEESTDFTVSGGSYDPSIAWGTGNWTLHLELPAGNLEGGTGLIALEDVALTVAPHNAKVLRSPNGQTQLRLWQHGLILGEFRDPSTRKLAHALTGVLLQSSPRSAVTGFALRPGSDPSVFSGGELLPGDATVAGGANPIQGGLTITGVVRNDGGNDGLLFLDFNPITVLPPAGINLPGAGTITVTGAAASTITMTGSGTLTLRPNPITSQPVAVAGGSTITLNPVSIGTLTVTANPINLTTTVINPVTTTTVASGSLNLTKPGSGTLTLTGANTFTGATVINSGTLMVDPGSGAAGTLTITGGSMLTNLPVNTVGSGTLTLTGNGFASGAGAIVIAGSSALNPALPPGSPVIGTVVTTATAEATPTP